MSNAKKINLLPGDYLFREGEFGQTAFIIEAGTIELVKFTGEEHTVLTELKKGALFGEMAIIDNSPRSASARAKTDCTVKVVSEDQLKKHLSSSPTASLDMMRRLASYVRTANERLSRDAFEEVADHEDASQGGHHRQQGRGERGRIRASDALLVEHPDETGQNHCCRWTRETRKRVAVALGVEPGGP